MSSSSHLCATKVTTICLIRGDIMILDFFCFSNTHSAKILGFIFMSLYSQMDIFVSKWACFVRKLYLHISLLSKFLTTTSFLWGFVQIVRLNVCAWHLTAALMYYRTVEMMAVFTICCCSRR